MRHKPIQPETHGVMNALASGIDEALNGDSKPRKFSDGRFEDVPPLPEPSGYRVPDGWRLVPVEPTEAMRQAAFGPIMHGGRGGPVTADFVRQAAALDTYRAMIDAAPPPPAEGESR